MTDWTELKRLAEETGGIEWHADMAVANDGAESRAIYHRPKPYHVVEIIETPDSALDNADCIHSESVWQFIAAANPKTILALIAENERHRELATKFKEETERLRAEVEALRQSVKDMLYAQHVRPSCQDGIVDRCRCWNCSSDRASAL